MAVSNVSGTSNPYLGTSYTPASTKNNTLDIQSYIQLLAVQLQNQDVTNPMDSSEMMTSMTQMAMVQALSTMTEAITANSAMSATTYAAGMIGKDVTVAVTETNPYGLEQVVGKKHGVVASVNLSGGTPTLRLEGDDKEYPLSYLMGIGDLTDKNDEAGETEGTESSETEIPETEQEGQ